MNNELQSERPDRVKEDLLPGQSSGRTGRTRSFTFNVIVTGRCNTGCTYCHYYEHRPRRDVWYDLPNNQYEHYLHVISSWKSAVPGLTNVRFSGGDPIVLGNRIFDMADRCFELAGIKPFMLTAGKGLSRSWIERARESRLSGVKVSVENPLSPDRGAPNPHEVVKKVRNFNSPECPVRLGVCVLKPSNFRDLHDIASWFYSEVGHLPVFHEVNYGFYEKPTDDDLRDLRDNLARVLQDFGEDPTLSLFPSVSPELSFGGVDPYVFDLDLENSYGVSAQNADETVHEILQNLRSANYPKLGCANSGCAWWEFCDNIKWYWKQDKHILPREKVLDYCKMKRTLNDAFYRSLVDPNHTETSAEYFPVMSEMAAHVS